MFKFYEIFYEHDFRILHDEQSQNFDILLSILIILIVQQNYFQICIYLNF